MKENNLNQNQFQTKYVQLKKTYNGSLLNQKIPKISNFDFKSIILKKSPQKQLLQSVKQSLLPSNISQYRFKTTVQSSDQNQRSFNKTTNLSEMNLSFQLDQNENKQQNFKSNNLEKIQNYTNQKGMDKQQNIMRIKDLEKDQTFLKLKEFKIDNSASANLVKHIQMRKKVLPKLQEKEEVLVGMHSRGGRMGGRNKTNQDRLLYDPNNFFKLVAVMDGHGNYNICLGEFGHQVSSFLTNYFQSAFRKIPSEQNPDFNPKILEIFSLAKENLMRQYFDSEQSGSTVGELPLKININYLALSVIFQDQVISANLGDSRVIVCGQTKDKFWVKQLTEDHKPDLPQERARIEQMGGFVHQYKTPQGKLLGPQRVWNADNYPGLAMARSMGDFMYHCIGISNIPEITTYKLTPDDKFIIWASDGVFQYLSNEQVLLIYKRQ